MSLVSWDYGRWAADTLHPEDQAAFAELLGGVPTLPDLMEIRAEHLEGMTGKTPGTSKRVWSAIESLQRKARIEELESQNESLKKELQGQESSKKLKMETGDSLMSAGDGGDTFEQDFKRLEGVLHELRRMNAQFSPEQGNPQAVAEAPVKAESETKSKLQPQAVDQLPASGEAGGTEAKEKEADEGEGGEEEAGEGDEDISKHILGNGNTGGGKVAENEKPAGEEEEEEEEDMSKFIIGYKKDDTEAGGKKADEEEEDEVDYSMFILGGGSNDEDEKNKLNPEDFMAKNKEGAVIVRKPGEIQGQSFTIDSLKNCTVALFDQSAQVQIDDCKGCKFFIGPCEGSVFVRNCEGCNFVVSCNQFRTRECDRCSILIHCAQGQPIIESSSELSFGPFDGAYKEIHAQLKSAGMRAWDTEWTNVHDFTPPKAGEGPNWQFVPSGTTAESLLGTSLQKLCDSITPESKPVVPRSWGRRYFDEERSELCFVVLGGNDPESLGHTLMESKSDDAKLIRSRVREMTQAEVQNLWGNAEGNELSGTVSQGTVIGAEFLVPKGSSGELIAKVLQDSPSAVSSSHGSARKLATEFFGALKAMNG